MRSIAISCWSDPSLQPKLTAPALSCRPLPASDPIHRGDSGCEERPQECQELVGLHGLAAHLQVSIHREVAHSRGSIARNENRLQRYAEGLAQRTDDLGAGLLIAQMIVRHEQIDIGALARRA